MPSSCARLKAARSSASACGSARAPLNSVTKSDHVIIEGARLAGPARQLAQDEVRQLATRPIRLIAQQGREALITKHPFRAAGLSGFQQAVGVEHEAIAWRDRLSGRLVLGERKW